MGNAFVCIVLALWAFWLYQKPRGGVSGPAMMIGLLLRLIGALVYLNLFSALYGGGDYGLYNTYGHRYAAWIVSGDWAHVFNTRAWLGETWSGTQFIVFVTATLVALLDLSLPILFLFFAALSYVGILLFVDTAHERLGPVACRRYTQILLFFPSLWFWPSALGKDALVLLGLGLVAWGGFGRRQRWIALVSGAGLVMCIRPQLAVLIVLALGVALWAAPGRRWTAGRLVGEAAIILGAGAAVVAASSVMGVSLLDTQQVSSYIEQRAVNSAYGGSAVALDDGRAVGPLGGFVTFFFRPFPWDIEGVLTLLAFVEAYVILFFVATRWRAAAALARSPAHRQLFVALAVFVLAYSVLAGMSVGNVGTLVRQKIHALPFLFLLVAVPVRVRARRKHAGAVRAIRPGAVST